jgi:uncharacterized protein YehS (DUF1456 family)
MQNWKQFFTGIGNYFVGAGATSEKFNDFWHPVRISSVKHFCPPTAHGHTILQRQIYIAEGSKAYRIAEAMKLAIQSSAQHYFIYKLRYDEYAKYTLLKKAASSKSVKNQLAEDVHDYLLREALTGAHARLHDQIVKISPLFSDEITQTEIKKYLEKKVAWEVKHPDEVYEESFIAPGTAYARHKKDTTIPMPHFKNTIGKINLFKHPLIATGYTIDAFRKLLLDSPARVICWLVNKLTFGNRVLRLFFSFILAGPFVLLNILFFGLAKAFAGDRFSYIDASPYPPLLEKENNKKIIDRKKSVKSGRIEHINKKNISHATHRTHRQK